MISCKFCEKDIPEPQVRDTLSMRRYHFKCEGCKAHYFWDVDENVNHKLKSYQIMISHGGEIYAAEFFPQTDSFRVHDGRNTIVKLDYTPNITPSNFRAKIATLIT